MRRTPRRFQPLRNVMVASWFISFVSFIAFAISNENIAWSVSGVIFGFVATILTIIYVPLALLTRGVGRRENSSSDEKRRLDREQSQSFTSQDVEIGRHGGGSAHIIRAARHYAIVFGNDSVAISEKFGDRRDAKDWIRDFFQTPESRSAAHLIPMDSIGKVILGPLVEIVTSDRRFFLDGWFNRRDDSHHRQLLAMVDHLGLVEQGDALPGTWARTPHAELNPAEAQGPSTGRVRPVLYRWGLGAAFLFFACFFALDTGSFSTGLLTATAITAPLATVLLTRGIDVDDRQITVTRLLSAPSIPWAQVKNIGVDSVYIWWRKMYMAVLTIEERTGKVRTLRFTPSLRAGELGQVLHMLRVNGNDLGLDVPRLAEFGFSPDHALERISCGGGQSMWDIRAGYAEARQPGRIRSS